MTNLCKIKTVKTESVELSGSKLILTVPEYDYIEGVSYNLVICQPIPKCAGVSQVIVQRGSLQLPFLTRTGSYVRADQLKTRKAYPAVYGLDPLHVSMLCLIPKSCYSTAYPCYSSFTVAEQVAEPVVEVSTKKG